MWMSVCLRLYDRINLHVFDAKYLGNLRERAGCFLLGVWRKVAKWNLDGHITDCVIVVTS